MAQVAVHYSYPAGVLVEQQVLPLPRTVRPEAHLLTVRGVSQCRWRTLELPDDVGVAAGELRTLGGDEIGEEAAHRHRVGPGQRPPRSVDTGRVGVDCRSRASSPGRAAFPAAGSAVAVPGRTKGGRGDFYGRVEVTRRQCRTTDGLGIHPVMNTLAEMSPGGVSPRGVPLR